MIIAITNFAIIEFMMYVVYEYEDSSLHYNAISPAGDVGKGQ